MMKNSKQGFNLIEIAIVLAVVGLVIGGIYVAASSVTDNQRKQKAQTQLLTIVQNMRTAYANQVWTSPAAPSYLDLQAARVFPADVQVATATSATGTYGALNITAPSATTFGVELQGVSEGACIDFLSKNFGTAQGINQIGLTAASVGGTAVTLPATVAAANTACGATNTMLFTFTIRS